jgi:hypothetical protein
MRLTESVLFSCSREGTNSFITVYVLDSSMRAHLVCQRTSYRHYNTAPEKCHVDLDQSRVWYKNLAKTMKNMSIKSPE